MTNPDRDAEAFDLDCEELVEIFAGFIGEWDRSHEVITVGLPHLPQLRIPHLRRTVLALRRLGRERDAALAEVERLTAERGKTRADAAELLDALETTSDDADRIADQRADYREEVMRLRGKVEWLGRVGRVEQERDDRKSLRLAYLRKIVMISYRNGWADAIETAGYETAKRSEQNAKEFATKFLAEVVEAEAADLAARDEREGGS